MPCSVTYEFRVIRWANSGSSCARGFRPHARRGKREEDGRSRKRNGYGSAREKSKGTEGENKTGKTTGADGGCAERSGKSPLRGWTPWNGYSGVGDGIGVVDADGR